MMQIISPSAARLSETDSKVVGKCRGEKGGGVPRLVVLWQQAGGGPAEGGVTGGQPLLAAAVTWEPCLVDADWTCLGVC